MLPVNNLNDNIATLNALMDEYIRWFSDVSKAVVAGSGEQVRAPAAFVQWASKLSLDKINLDGRYSVARDEFVKRHENLMAAAAGLQADGFAAFADEAQKFITDVRSFCQHIALEQWGLDVLTGLKNNAVVKRDLAIEMERLAREGYPFCVGMARIDDFAEMQKANTAGDADKMVKIVAGLVQKSLRTYDDAYRISRDHFIMCLKQSDIVGGQKALERLRDILEEAAIVYDVNGQDKPLSLSCCVAAPLPGDDIEDLLDNLNVDLDEQIKDQGSVLTYQEMSPLERFMQKTKD